MQEEIENRSINLAITTTRLTGHTIVAGIKTYLNHRAKVKSQKLAKTAEGPHGKMTVKELIGKEQGVSSIPLDDSRIRDFERVARKYGVDFAVTKDKTQVPPKYTIFFKAKDADALTAIVGDYTKKQLRQKERPSLLKQLTKLKAIVAALPNKVRNKEQEHSL
ncbi:PcfB family protein [Galactobacillus timonensis]|uniref:PcfB family protein n=1 Tax=Galactobacillus timonensis TaxID=2041840 RepID=UPI00240A0A16|nr:PcfB family protein [Galactobacillus timonensis]MDD6680731.1 PcfB family protein [Galactobacillus timonensis]